MGDMEQERKLTCCSMQEVTRALGAALPSAASCDDVTAQYASQGSTGFHSHTDAPKQIQASYMSSLFERIPE